jgi:hypothetical protein
MLFRYFKAVTQQRVYTLQYYVGRKQIFGS